MKKILLLLLLFFNQNILFAMEEDNPGFFINSQNSHGETSLVYAASHDNWPCVNSLLEHGANPKLKDNYGQSLFSKIFYTPPCLNIFNTYLQKYSPEEINAECKAMPLLRDTKYQITPEVHCMLTDTLNGKDLGAYNQESTACIMACTCNYIPYILEFFKRNKNYAQCNNLYKLGGGTQFLIPLSNRMLFALRESSNNGSCLSFPVALIRAFFKKCYKEHSLLPEVAKLIQQKYIRLLIQDLPEEHLSTVEAYLWQPVCIQACQLMGIEDTNKQQCLTRILLMLQKQKTELNVKLLLAQEEKA